LEETTANFFKLLDYLVQIKHTPLINVDKISEEQITDLDIIILFRIFEIPELNITELGNSLKISQSKISRLVDKLYKKNLLLREEKLFDRRNTKLILTEKGIKKLYETAFFINKQLKKNLNTKIK
jgi:DNA-binding MarR family transcriptional regulator